MASQTTPTLLTLPTELQTKIFRYALTSKSDLRPKIWSPSSSEIDFVGQGLLLASKQTYEQGFEIFYRYNTFAFWFFPRTDDWSSSDLATLTHRNLSFMRKIFIAIGSEVAAGCLHTTNQTQPDGGCLIEVLSKLPNLEVLTFIVNPSSTTAATTACSKIHWPQLWASVLGVEKGHIRVDCLVRSEWETFDFLSKKNTAVGIEGAAKLIEGGLPKWRKWNKRVRLLV